MPDDLVGQLIWAFMSSTEDLASVENAARAGRLSGIWLLPTQMPSAAASITLLRGTLTPPSERPLIMATHMARRFGPAVGAQLRTALAAIGWDTAEVLMLDPTPDSTQIRKAVEDARASGWAALLHFNQVASFDPEAVPVSEELIEIARQVRAAGVPLAVASLGSPYVLPRFSAASALLCSYSTSDASLHAMLRVVFGDKDAPGRLPVSVD